MIRDSGRVLEFLDFRGPSASVQVSNTVSDNNDEPQAELNNFCTRVFAHSADLVDWATAPVTFLRTKESTLENTFDRTGILLAIGELHFLITAEHNIEELIHAGYVPCVAAARPDVPVTPILCNKFYVSHEPLTDMAVFRLETDAVRQILLGDYRFLRLDRVRIAPPSPKEGPFFLVTGFPTGSVDRDEVNRERANIARLLTVPFKGTNEEIEHFVPESHIVLEYDANARHTSGNAIPPPKAPGLSGCGIWYLPTPFGMHGWSRRDIHLVGVQTAWHRSRGYLKGTIIAHALAMIWGWFSDSRDAMRINGLEYRRGRMRLIRP